jgi:hypothetical protein
LLAHINKSDRKRLSPKCHIDGEIMRDAIFAGDENAEVQASKKAGARPAFSGISFGESEDQYFAMTGPPQR